jgi:hypothetical protein
LALIDRDLGFGGYPMVTTMDQSLFTAGLFDLLLETFEEVRGIYLDRGTSLFETLDLITSMEASIPVSETCASLAAQVAHVNFYLEVMERFLRGEVRQPVDWDEIWITVSEVSPAEWDAYRSQLKQTYQRLLETLRSYDNWAQENAIGAALAIIAHTAYHLGEIRQALCWIRSNNSTG